MTNAIAGKTGYWRSANTAFPMKEWELELVNARIDTTNFTSSGFSESISGFTSGTMRARGVFDPTITQLVPGANINCTLGLGLLGATNYALTFNGVLTRVRGSTRVDNHGDLEIEAATNGQFDTTFAAA